MRLPTWLRRLAARFSRVPTPRTRRRWTFQPRVEILEDRTAPAVFSVTTTGDNSGLNPDPFAGTGTLRQAIIDANATPGADTIDFALPDSLKGPNGWWTIQPLSALPDVTAPAIIDGWSQAGAGPGLAPKVMLDGSSAGVASGLMLDDHDTVRGLAVGNFTGTAGIMLNGTITGISNPAFGGNTVQGCYVGLDPSGTTAAPNIHDGVGDLIATNSLLVGNTIGGANPGEGNVISGNGRDVDSRGYGVTIRGNIIGLDAAGTAAVNPVGINGSTLVIGFLSSNVSTSVIADNVIAGSYGAGIGVGDVNHVRITGNKIGTDITGTHAISNGADGINVGSATDIIIGGTDPGSGNVIAASGLRGIFIGGGTPQAQVQGNYVGIPASGVTTPGFGNGRDGILIGSSDGCLIGGSDPGAGNVIAGNDGCGILIESGSSTSDNVIRGNVIRDNASSGVAISQRFASFPAPVGDTISENSIYGNAGPGIDLLSGDSDPGGVTLNDSLGHDGANHFQNFPILTGLTSTASGITVTGSLTQTVTPNTSFRIEFFANTEVGYLGPDGFYYGEGERFLGSVDVVSDANGYAPITASLPPLLAGEKFITATATNLATGDTSEFSKAIPQTVLATPTVAVTDAGGTYNGQPFAATATITGVDGQAVTSLEGVGLTLDYQELDSQGSVIQDLGASAPTQAGSYQVTASFAGSPDYTPASSSTSFTIAQATPIFSLVAPPTIIAGTANTQITGAIAAGSLIPPSTESVTITVNGASYVAAINPDGTFAVMVPTASLGTGSYTIDYSYAGDNNFMSASATANMDVTNGVLALFNQSKAKNAGSTIPIQIELVSAAGQDLSSAGTTVTAVGMAATTDTTDMVGSIDPVQVGALQPVQSAGDSNPDNVFREQGGTQPYYMYNLQTPTGLTAGTYRLYLQVQGDPLLHWVTFSVS